ncbi:hypothetical protein IM043_gp265 [Bacillus phage SPG24]|nr:hypothetical protein IM043_gp265 [Bacillus phage SPG24]
MFARRLLALNVSDICFTHST